MLRTVLKVNWRNLALNKSANRKFQGLVNGVPKEYKASKSDSEVPKYDINTRLGLAFCETMADSPAPLFQCLETYKASLPVREGETVMKLYEHPFFARQTDMNSMVSTLLMKKRVQDRGKVFYIAGPSHSGKSACVLPAFLESRRSLKRPDGFTHYLYVAFNNNGGFNFRVSPPEILTENSDHAYVQGADFIHDCLDTLLNRPEERDEQRVNIREYRPIKDVRNDLHSLLETALGSNYKCLIHLDEHYKMCNRENQATADMAKFFSRGAMETLSRIKGVTVIATYVGGVPVPPDKSSMVCRLPTIYPLLDIKQLIAYYNIPLPWDEVNTNNRILLRLKATLYFRLAAKLLNMGLSLIHNDEERNKFTKEFVDAQQIHADDIKKYHECTKFLRYKRSPPIDDDFFTYGRNVVRLLIGAKDSDNIWDRKVFQLISIGGASGDIVGTTLDNLLGAEYEGNIRVFNEGQDLFGKIMTGKPDLLSSTPLEVAYCWTLSCAAALDKNIIFGDIQISFECTNLEPGRIFPRSDEAEYDLSELKPNTMYYVQGEKDPGSYTHPLADIFFLSEDNELVMVDITGGRDANKKKDRLLNWIKMNQKEVSEKFQYDLIGVVLAPLVDEESFDDGNVFVVQGKDALSLLGSLGTMASWYGDSEEDA